MTAAGATVIRAGEDGETVRARRLTAEAAALWQKYPPRVLAASWPATRASRGTVVSAAMACPYAAGENDQSRHFRRMGVIRTLDWLEAQPGPAWQDRWRAGCLSAAGQDWRDCAERWLKDAGRIAAGNRAVWPSLGGALGLLIGCDVIRPDLGWLLASPTPARLAADMARVRDPDGFAALQKVADPAPVSVTSTRRAMRQVAVMMSVKGGQAGDITVGDCLELLEARAGSRGARDKGGTYFYQLLHAAGFLPADAPSRVRMLDPRVHGQQTAAQLIDRYDLACRPVRDLLIDYLNERSPGIDYVTLGDLAYQLGLLFWKDLETHHPGIDSLDLAPDVAVAWKQRMQYRTVEAVAPGGERTQARVPRLSVVDHLTRVRSFYLDIAEWAVTDPSRWAQWAVPCPVRPSELTHRQALRQRKSRTDQRTRERLPVLPRLIAAAERERAGTAARLAAATGAAPGQEFTAAGQSLVRAVLKEPSPRIWAEGSGAGKRRDMTAEEEHAFWAWAIIELLRHSGIRVEELTELSHHSFIRYQMPGTAEPIPLLHIAPSKTDIERMLVISPELSEALAVIVARIRTQGAGAVPLVTAYDPLECVWNPPSPLLLQHRTGVEDRPFSRHYIKRRLEDTAVAAGLRAATGAPLTFTPHDMRRIFTTEALQNGLPPHICQLILGHRNLNTTMGYNTVYPEKVITGHRAFLARRRQLRPAEEYRTPTEAEWEEFLGHFERRKVALGDCGRAYGTGCVHEMACERCSLLRIDPAQRPRLIIIRDSLAARVAEAGEQGWLGELEGLQVSLATVTEKLQALDARLSRRSAVTNLGMPGPARAEVIADRATVPETPLADKYETP
ncbi:MAG: tyrosine-type recombinase/integrase [Streptosporangiaceae bacterium]